MAARPAAAGESRFKSYKTKGLDVEEVKRRKEEEGLQLRKSKREEQLSKRRNVELLVGNPFELKDTDKLPLDTPVNVLARAMYDTNPIEQLAATKTIRTKLSTEHNPPISEVIDVGLVPRLVEFLSIGMPPPLQRPRVPKMIYQRNSYMLKAITHIGHQQIRKDIVKQEYILNRSHSVLPKEWVLSNMTMREE